ncbi:hypothetical protein KFK09_004030 [Dendrobium nobile]|uniref:DUF4283 domain-containing protein n=1 Tax=Dendrobium nobile TaxID=94219 RepID=A0A8T3BZ77_DENNO|nr:hypothetical protein KFK09_004030 [Dendrobium nobile]
MYQDSSVATMDDDSGSPRCDPPLVTTPAQEFASRQCPQAACENATGGSAGSVQHQQTSRAKPMPLGSPPTGMFSWNKLQCVPLSRLNKEVFLGKDGKSMDPKIEAIRSNIAKLDRALVPKVLGRRISFPLQLNELKRRWYQFVEFDVIAIAPNSFICLFASPEARDAILMSRPWIIAGNIIGMDKWSPNSSPNSLHGMHSPIWIRLPQLPLIYWDVDNINRIANMFGDPLWMDLHTSSWGKSSYARICVRIDVSQWLLLGIWINGIHGHFFQRVEYEGLPTFSLIAASLATPMGAAL